MPMKLIKQIETQLPGKHKALLLSLREHNWKVISYDDEYSSDWYFDQKWIIESTREEKGTILELWFYKYNGEYDGMDTVVATRNGGPEPDLYSTCEPSIHFDKKGFEKQLRLFITSLHKLRIHR